MVAVNSGGCEAFNTTELIPELISNCYGNWTFPIMAKKTRRGDCRAAAMFFSFQGGYIAMHRQLAASIKLFKVPSLVL